MPPKFGTSGLRGLVRDLSESVVSAHVGAFLAACPVGSGLCVGRDLRASSPRIAEWVARAAQARGVPVRDCGPLPTPALALHAAALGAGAIMVTGSHIPADRNGLKFYSVAGEITKDDEARILAAMASLSRPAAELAPVVADPDAIEAYRERHIRAFGAGVLSGLRVGVFTHSAVGRDALVGLLAELGAETVELGRSETFVPVDTEACGADILGALRGWASDHDLVAILSTDGDGDRPLVADERGALVPGDVLGQMAAAVLGADVAVTPVSSNTGAELGCRFRRVLRTRIGSPFVIAGMMETGGRVAGYEANGGFLLGFEATGPAGPLAPLRTRDAMLPMLVSLWRTACGVPLSDQVAAEPARFTASDRRAGVSPEAGRAFLQRLMRQRAATEAFLESIGASCLAASDVTDGLRMTLTDGRILHLRPSGNAPEFRVYAEAGSPQGARDLCAAGIAGVAAELGRAD